MLEQLEIYVPKRKTKNSEYIQCTTYKINLKSINHLNIKLKTVKCLEENIGESICDFWFAKEILDTMPEQSIKDKNS